MEITLNKNTLLIALLSVVIIYFGWKVYHGGNQELDLYKTEHEKDIKIRDDKYHSDSIALCVKYNYLLQSRDSALQKSQAENQKQILVINYYKKKLNYVQVAPISAIDHELDSLFSRHH
jgi:hypothetical protein